MIKKKKKWNCQDSLASLLPDTIWFQADFAMKSEDSAEKRWKWTGSGHQLQKMCLDFAKLHVITLRYLENI